MLSVIISTWRNEQYILNWPNIFFGNGLGCRCPIPGHHASRRLRGCFVDSANNLLRIKRAGIYQFDFVMLWANRLKLKMLSGIFVPMNVNQRRKRTVYIFVLWYFCGIIHQLVTGESYIVLRSNLLEIIEQVIFLRYLSPSFQHLQRVKNCLTCEKRISILQSIQILLLLKESLCSVRQTLICCDDLCNTRNYSFCTWTITLTGAYCGAIARLVSESFPSGCLFMWFIQLFVSYLS